MAKDIVVRFIADTRNFERGTDKAKKSVHDLKGFLKEGVKDIGNSIASLSPIGGKVVSMLGQITPKALAIGAAFGAMAFGIKKSIDVSAEIETLITSFTTMLGSSKAALKHVNDLEEFANQTPFDVTDLANSSQQLMQFGVEVNDMLPTLRMLGDVAGSNKERFNGLALVFGQVRSAGKLQGQDLMQFINQGFNPLQIMAEKTGKSYSFFRQEMEKGRFTADMVTESFKIATSEGGKFFGNLKAQSFTFLGLMSTLYGVIKAIGTAFTGVKEAAAGDKNTFWFQIKGVLSEIITGIQWFIKVAKPILKELGSVLGAVFKAVWDTLKAIGAVLLVVFAPAIALFAAKWFIILEVVKFVAKAISWIINLIFDAIAATAKWFDKTFKIVENIKLFIENIKVLFFLIKTLVDVIIQDIADAFTNAFKNIGETITTAGGLLPSREDRRAAARSQIQSQPQQTITRQRGQAASSNIITNTKNANDNKNIVVNVNVSSESTAKRLINGGNLSGMPQVAF